MLWRHDFQMVTIRHNLALQLTIDHQVKLHQTTFLTQTLYLLKRMYGQCMQVIVRPAVALKHDMFHHTSVRMSNANDIIKFINQSKDTNGGDSDEFYELVIRKIVEETPWRDNSTKVILLISDAAPHPLGYTYQDYVVRNQIDWRIEARNASQKGIK